MIAAGQQATRHYAKRQYTWFAHQPPADWPRFTEPLEGRRYRRARWHCSAPKASEARMDLLRDADIDPAPLAGKRVAILGYGNQGRAQALNLHDSGIDVVVGLRDGSASAAEARGAGLEVAALADAVAGADVVMMLAPDEMLGALYREIEPHLRDGAALGFSHGLAVRFGLIEPRADLDVFLRRAQGARHRAAVALHRGQGHDRAVGGRAGRQRARPRARPRLRPRDRLRPRRPDRVELRRGMRGRPVQRGRRWCGARFPKS